ncbi:MAG: C39 family peptidase [Lysinibacillus sp.]
MKWRLILTGGFSLFLSACQTNDMQGHGDGKEMVVMPVEYYSGAAISNVLVEVYDEAGERIGAETSDGGEAVFSDVKPDETYVLRVGPDEDVEDGAWSTQKTVVFNPSNPYVVVETHAVGHEQALAVPVHLQNPQLPHGCEITALTAVLDYYGADVDKVSMAKDYLPKQAFTHEGDVKYGPDPDEFYAGEPSSEQGTYSFAGPVVQAADSYIADHEMDLVAENRSGSTPREIERYVELGIPVISWVTLDLSEPQTRGGWWIAGKDTFHDMYTNLHVVVIVDITENAMEVMDPLKGIVQLNRQQFFNSYEALGEQAVILY